MGQSPDSRTYNDTQQGLPFFQGKTEFGEKYPTIRKWCSEPKKIAEAGDILLSIRAPVGPTNIAVEKSAIGRGLAAIRAVNEIDENYLFYLLKNGAMAFTAGGTGSTFAAVSGDFVREFRCPSCSSARTKAHRR